MGLNPSRVATERAAMAKAMIATQISNLGVVWQYVAGVGTCLIFSHHPTNDWEYQLQHILK